MIKPYYSEPGIEIYCGDCRDILPQLPKVNMITITDPLYGVTQNKWDDINITYGAFDQLNAWVCTCQNPGSAKLIWRYIHLFKYSDVWEKTQAVGFLNCNKMPLRKHEDILIFGNLPYNPQIKKKKPENVRPHGETALSDNYGKFKTKRVRTIPENMTYPTSVLKFENEQGTSHPTQKPIKLFKYLILTYSNDNDIILDCFMGSGTTLRAAKDLGRKAIGIEIEEKYCDIAVQRLKQQVLL